MVRACDAGPVSVEMVVEEDGLRVRLVAGAEPRAWGEVVDRVTTLGGRWATSGAAPDLRVDVWLPR